MYVLHNDRPIHVATDTRNIHAMAKRTSTRSRGTVLPMMSIFLASSESQQMKVRKKISRRMTCRVSWAVWLGTFVTLGRGKLGWRVTCSVVSWADG